MLKYSKEKTMELLSDMKKKGHIAQVSDLAKHLKSQGLVVKESIGRRRSYVEISPQLYGVNLGQKEKTTREFFSEHVKQGKLSFIPARHDKALTNAEGSVRIARRRAAIGFDQKFMTMPIYEEFQKKFEESKLEYFNIRDQIVSEWEMLMLDFQRNLAASLDDLNSLDKEILMTSILQKIPSREAYRDSFYMLLNIETFPVADNIAMFTPEVQQSLNDSVNEQAIRSMYEMISLNINEAFIQGSKILTTLQKKNKANERSVKTMGEVARRMRQKNILDNDTIRKIADKAEKVSVLRGEDVGEAIEEMLVIIYDYAEGLGVADDLSWIDCPLTLNEMRKLSEMYKVMV